MNSWHIIMASETNRLIIPDECHAGNSGAIRRRERLAGMLNYYYPQPPEGKGVRC